MIFIKLTYQEISVLFVLTTSPPNTLFLSFPSYFYPFLWNIQGYTIFICVQLTSQDECNEKNDVHSVLKTKYSGHGYSYALNMFQNYRRYHVLCLSRTQPPPFLPFIFFIVSETNLRLYMVKWRIYLHFAVLGKVVGFGPEGWKHPTGDRNRDKHPHYFWRKIRASCKTRESNVFYFFL